MNLVYSNSLTKLFSLIFYYFITNVYFNSNVKIMKVVWLITGWLLIVNKCIFQNFSLLFLFCFQTVTSFLFQKIVTFHKCKLDKECEREREVGPIIWSGITIHGEKRVMGASHKITVGSNWCQNNFSLQNKSRNKDSRMRDIDSLAK
jgi:hypothetical protein